MSTMNTHNDIVEEMVENLGHAIEFIVSNQDIYTDTKTAVNNTIRTTLTEAHTRGYEEGRESVVKVLRELYSLVQGECPSLLNEDSGGDAELAIKIESHLKTVTKTEDNLTKE